MKQYVFDGSWTGLLTAVFEYFERKEKQAQLIHEKFYQPEVFNTALIIHSDEQKAKRVNKGLLKHLDTQQRRKLYCTFLSELPECYNALLQILIKIFSGQSKALDNYGDTTALFISQTARSVEREKHRMQAFIRFKKSNDGLFFAVAEPDFNVLPLIADFFKNRYADQPWLIYDVKRKYGLHYDRSSVSEITLAPVVLQHHSTAVTAIACDTLEEKYQTLWQAYFNSTNIAARKNMKLHVQHVPKRYWRYLTEKQGDLKL